jgi:hypothetical protein
MLYIDESQVDKEVTSHLGSGIVVKPYGAIFDDLKAYGESATKESVGTPRILFHMSLCENIRLLSGSKPASPLLVLLGRQAFIVVISRR